ncbi:MAG: chitobiase/beta-hexosaminidase C-terminal domain-containing protein, partial [Silvibacterium sp.]
LTAANYSFSYVNGTLTISGGTQGQPAAPVIYPASGTYITPETLVITDTTTGAAIYYTTDSSVPTSSSTLYTGPVELSSTEKVQAIAIANGATSALSSATYTTTEINYLAGAFTAGGLTLNGGANFTGNVLQLTDGGTGEARSAWFSAEVLVSSFTTDFTFQLLNPAADGFTFTIQNAKTGPTALGSGGGGLGYQGIGKSIAVKFDLYNNNGEGPNSTGLYKNGAAPTIPAIDLTPSGINLHSGDVMHAHMTYNGAILTMTLTDTQTNATVTENFSVNIPSIVGGNSAYVGFTAGTGGLSATQNILSWSYSSVPQAAKVTAAPAILPNNGTYTGPITVSMASATPASSIYYTTDGSTPTSASTLYSAPITVSGNAVINAIAIAAGYSPSSITTAEYFTPEMVDINFPSGAFTANGLTLNGGANVTGNILQLTDGGTGETRSVWFSAEVPVSSFTTDFTFQLLNPAADGFTFTIQNVGTRALGGPGGSLGYQGISKSVAVKFDLYNNNGEGPNSTGLYKNGAAPTTPAIDLTPSGINLHSGDVMHARLFYDGTALVMTLTDTQTNASVTESFAVNIPGIVGGNSAYVGFTAGTGGVAATQNILSWSYNH